ncbi:MAG TPA: hypothetical protein VNN81_05615 [Bradyrhizobium sp.]|nr:hypothetical protein [Bradyrhizobium sp.]
MQTALYFRDQAALCLEIAWQMNDPQAAENLRAIAAQHSGRAAIPGSKNLRQRGRHRRQR